MRKHKRCFVNFAFYDRENLETYLEAQAALGWMVKKIRLWSASILFERIEPTRRHFCVVFHQNKIVPSNLTPKQREFMEYCQYAGWNLATCANRMAIFYNEEEDPIPIQTDPLMEVQSIRASTKDVGLDHLLIQAASYIGFLLLYFLLFILRPVSALTGSNYFASHFLTVCLNLTVCLPEVLAYHLWYRKARIIAAYGGFPESKSSLGILFSTLLVLFSTIGLTAIFHTNTHPTLSMITNISIAVVLACVVWSLLRAVWRRPARAALRSSALLLRIVCAVLMFIFLSANIWVNDLDRWQTLSTPEQLPLAIEDISESEHTNCEITLRKNRHTRLISITAYRQTCDHASFDYEITYIYADFMYDLIRDDLMQMEEDKCSLVPIDAAQWGANEAYRCQATDYFSNGFVITHSPGDWLNSYFLCYDDCIVQIYLSWEPTAEQMAIVGQKLGGNS